MQRLLRNRCSSHPFLVVPSALPALPPSPGLKAFKKKDEEDLSFFTSLQKTKGGKKGGKGGSASAPAPADGAKGKKINHSLEILKTFMQFNIEVPLTTDKLSETIAKVRRVQARRRQGLTRGRVGLPWRVGLPGREMR